MFEFFSPTIEKSNRFESAGSNGRRFTGRPERSEFHGILFSNVWRVLFFVSYVETRKCAVVSGSRYKNAELIIREVFT